MKIIERSANTKRVEGIKKLIDKERVLRECAGKTVIVFGTSEISEAVTDLLNKDGIEINSYVELNNMRQNCCFLNKSTNSINILFENYKEDICIIMACFDWKENQNMMKKMGISNKHNMIIPFSDTSINHNLTYSSQYDVHSGVIDVKNRNLKIFHGKDDIGRLMLNEKERRLYRLIYKNQIEYVKSIYDILEKNNLFGNYIVDTKLMEKKDLINISENISEKVLEHKYIDKIIGFSEFSKNMIEKSAVFVLELIKKLSDVGLTLRNIEMSDITYNNGKFILLDYGCVVPRGEILELNFIKNYISIYINSLLYINNVQSFKDSFLTIKEKLNIRDIIGYLSDDQIKTYNYYEEKLYKTIKSNDIDKIIEILQEWIIISNNSSIKTNWTNYHSNKKSNAKLDVDQKDEALINLINKIDISDAIDIGGNSGYYSYILANRGVDCILTDIDSSAVDNAFHHIIENKIRKVTPMVKDFTQLVNGIEPVDKLKSDLVMMLALVHHLTFAQQLSFKNIIDTCCKLSKKYLLIEFIEKEDAMIKDFRNVMFNWYTKENFEDELRISFNIIDKLYTEKNRVVYLCEKKNI